MKKLTKWEMGFLICLCNTVHGHGINTGEMENYRFIGSPSPEQCRRSGMTDFDISAIEQLQEYCKG